MDIRINTQKNNKIMKSMVDIAFTFVEKIISKFIKRSPREFIQKYPAS